MYLARCMEVFLEDLFMFRFKAKETLQRCGVADLHLVKPMVILPKLSTSSNDI